MSEPSFEGGPRGQACEDQSRDVGTGLEGTLAWGFKREGREGKCAGRGRETEFTGLFIFPVVAGTLGRKS